MTLDSIKEKLLLCGSTILYQNDFGICYRKRDKLELVLLVNKNGKVYKSGDSGIENIDDIIITKHFILIKKNMAELAVIFVKNDKGEIVEIHNIKRIHPAVDIPRLGNNRDIRHYEGKVILGNDRLNVYAINNNGKIKSLQGLRYELGYTIFNRGRDYIISPVGFDSMHLYKIDEELNVLSIN